MIPDTIGTVDVEVIKQPAFTYRLDFDKKRIAKYTDGIEAMEQFIYKALQTYRYKHEIYNWNYGLEIDDLMGKPVTYAKAKLPGRIRDALIHDDRVLSVSSFTFPVPTDNVYSAKRNTVVVSFIVSTIYGNINVTKGMFFS